MDKIFYSVGEISCSVLKMIGLNKVCRTYEDWYNVGIITLVLLGFIIGGMFTANKSEKEKK